MSKYKTHSVFHLLRGIKTVLPEVIREREIHGSQVHFLHPVCCCVLPRGVYAVFKYKTYSVFHLLQIVKTITKSYKGKRDAQFPGSLRSSRFLWCSSEESLS